MKRTIGRVIRLWQSEGVSGVEIDLAERIQVEPGQYLQSKPVDPSVSILPVSLFPMSIHDLLVRAVTPAYADWDVNTELTIRGPLGNGFHIPGNCSHLSLAAFDVHPYRLASLARQTVEIGLDVNLYLDPGKTCFDIHDFPKQMEILPLDQLKLVDQWADYLAIDAPFESIESFNDHLPGQLKCPAEVLIHTAMPCGGLAECGICAVKTKRGWKYVCKDGPVFEVNDLITE